MAQVVAPVPVDADAIGGESFDFLQANVPGYEPHDGNLEVWIVLAMARIAARYGLLITDVLDAIFRSFGALVNVPPIDATQATVASTWTMINTAGHTVPAGTKVGIPSGTGDLVAFETTADFTVVAPATATGVGAVPLRAVVAGSSGSGLSGTPQLIDPLDYVASVAIVGSTSGGVDAELDDDYLDRLSDELQLLTPRPIVPFDFEVLARSVPGVDRALALDGYNPADSTSGNERMVAVAVISEAGVAVSGPIKTAVDTLLQSLREVNFVVNVIDPTSTTIKVSTTVVKLPGWDSTVVDDAVTAALTAYLSPADWGQTPGGDTREWRKVDTVRIGELYAAINAVDGVDYVSALTFAKTADALAATDVVLPGAAPLPAAGTINVTVS